MNFPFTAFRPAGVRVNGFMFVIEPKASRIKSIAIAVVTACPHIAEPCHDVLLSYNTYYVYSRQTIKTVSVLYEHRYIPHMDCFLRP